MKFLKIIVRKVLLHIVLLMVILLFIYVSARAIPGDPVTVLLGEIVGDPHARRVLESKLGLDKPMYVQFLIYIKNVFTGSWGRSIYTGESVTSIILRGFLFSLKLALTSTVLVLTLCLFLLHIEFVLGLNSRVLQMATSMLSSTPTAIWATVILLLLAWLRLPIVFGNIIPPLIVLTIVGTGIFYKLFKQSVEYGYLQPFIVTLIAMGYSRERIFLKILRYSLPVALSALLYRVGLIIAGAVIIESIFRYPGMGFTFYLALSSRDYPVLVGWGVVVSIILVILNLSIDIIHSLVDPRVSSYEA
ncbi:MAG: ABC transporter permease [Ignisphaera sp.]